MTEALRRLGGMIVRGRVHEAVASMRGQKDLRRHKEKKPKSGAHKQRMHALKALERQLQQTLNSC